MIFEWKKEKSEDIWSIFVSFKGDINAAILSIDQSEIN